MQRRPAFLHESQGVRPRQDDMAPLYAELFETPVGTKVLEDMARIADQPSIDHNAINPNTAVWIVARQALVKQIASLIERGNRKN